MVCFFMCFVLIYDLELVLLFVLMKDLMCKRKDVIMEKIKNFLDVLCLYCIK